MKTAVFVGPSLQVTQVRTMLPTASILPPAGVGDIYQAVLQGYRRILLIDGEFKSRPAVWHKEIHYALSRQVLMIGCSSMGALRAAELQQIGMIGSGWVYEQYSEGHIHDDDEVAVTFCPQELEFQPVSLALAAIRYGLLKAETTLSISHAFSRLIIKEFKKLYYPDRTPKRLTQLIMTTECSGVTLLQRKHLASCLTSEWSDIKRLDAIATIEQLDLFQCDFHKVPPFVESEFWRMFIERREESLSREGQADLYITDQIMDVYKLVPFESVALYWKAWIQTLEQYIAENCNVEISRQQFNNSLNFIRFQRNLIDNEKTQSWLASNQLSSTDLYQWAKQHAISNALRVNFHHKHRSMIGRISKINLPIKNEIESVAHRINNEHGSELDKIKVDAILDEYKKKYQAIINSPISLYADQQGFTAPKDFLAALIVLKENVNIRE